MQKEIRGLWELLDEGAISEEDYRRKKAEILGIETSEEKAAREEAARAASARKTERTAKIKRIARRWGIPCGAIAAVILCAVIVWDFLIVPSIPKSAYVATGVTYYSDGSARKVDASFDAEGNRIEWQTASGSTSSTYDIDEVTGCCIKRTMADGDVDYTQEITEIDKFKRPLEIERTYSDGDTETYTISYHESGEVGMVQGSRDGYWWREYYDADGFLQYSYDSADFFDHYEWSEDHAELVYYVEHDGKDGKRQYYTYEYDENGSVSKVYKSGKLVEAYEYTLFDDCSPWAYAWSGTKPVKWGI